VDPGNLRDYARRHWAEAGDLDRAHWAAEFAARGPASALAASRALWEHMRAVRPDWPTEADRARDLEQHLALRRLLDRAAHAFRGR
jgi:hypothetical protein